MQCSLHTTPFASPTSLFQSSLHCPGQLGVLRGDLSQVVLRTLEIGSQWATSFVRTDPWETPETPSLNVLNEWIRSDSRCNFVFLLNRQFYPLWSALEGWMQGGRARLLCEISKL